MLTSSQQTAINREKQKYPAGKQQSAVIAALAIVQADQGWLSEDSLRDVARTLDMSPMAVYEVASFYNMFNLKPVGRYKLTVCTNLPCMLTGAEEALQYLCDKLGVEDGGTTVDKLFTVGHGECFGACGDAPVVLVNNHEMKVKMNRAALDEMINTLKAKRASEAGAQS